MAVTRLSRRKLAMFLAQELVDGANVSDVMTRAAAYLIEAKKTHDAELLVRDIEEALMKYGTVIADVESARPLSDEMNQALIAMLGAKELHVRQKIDPFLLGGVKIAVPGKRLDQTMRRRLTILKSTHV